MANNFNSALGHITDTWSVVYTVPTGKKSILLECDICNTSATAIFFSIAIAQGVGDTPDYYLAKDNPLPAGATVPIIQGQKIILKEDSVNTRIIMKVSSTNTADAIVSILEDVQ
jgi:hypothetical protein